MADGNKDLSYRQWTPEGPVRAVFLLVHGLGAHTGRWEAMAEFFRARGILSCAVELHRTGSFAGYFSDTMCLYEKVSRENPSKGVFLVGESLGALAAFLLAARHPGLFRGLVCISPAFANRIKLSAAGSIGIALALVYGPKKLFRVPFDSSMCTRDAAYREKMDADPREHRNASAALLADIIFRQLCAGSVRRMDTPALFLVAGDDRIIDHAATRRVFGRISAEDKTLEEFPGMYHALTIDTGKEAVFRKIAEWVEKRI